MHDALPKPLRSLSTNQLAGGAVILILIVFLIIGSLTSTPDPATSIGVQSQPFLVLAILAFGGGLLSFLSPCTLPILPAYFAFAFQSGRTQIAANTVSFILGVATMFSLLGATASAIGRVLRDSGNLILLIGGSLIIIFGVMSLIGKGFTGVQSEESVQRNTTMAGSYGFGLTFAVGWSSCVGPILGVVLTMAATTDSVLRGMLLLFIYAMGLGLPLIIISTFFGRTSRKSLFWRILRGKGWDWTTHAMVVGIVWALAIWRILVAVADYLVTRADPLAGLPAWQEWGLLVVALVGVALWIFTQAGDKQMTINLHTTQLFSGVLFIFMGVLMLNGSLATFNSIVPEDLATWFADIEEGFTDSFQNRFEVEVPAIPAPAVGTIIDLEVTTENGLFQSEEWTDPVEFSIRQRSIADGVDVRLGGGGEDPLKTTIVPPGQVAIEINFISSVEANTRLFTLTGLGGGRFESIDFGYVCDDGGSCEIREIDILEFADAE